jgi:hypothetical protein
VRPPGCRSEDVSCDRKQGHVEGHVARNHVGHA